MSATYRLLKHINPAPLGFLAPDHGGSTKGVGLMGGAFALLLLSACSSDFSPMGDRVRMPVNLYIPATDESLVSTRAAGDPGTYEKFKLPTYAYIYIVTKDENSKDYITMLTQQLKGSWTKKKYDGALATAKDSVYQYNGYIDIYLPTKRQARGTVYAALSTVELTGLPVGNEGTISSLKSESDVQNLQFTMSENIQAELQNIYSTPYNYKINSTYYGTLDNMDKINPSINIVLYHIASKLDINWNVPTDMQSSVALSAFTLSTPQPEKCYIFKPLENTATASRTEPLTIDAGNQWYGRAYRYVIPVADTDSKYTFSVTLTNSLSTATDKTKTASITTTSTIDKSQPFTPWILGKVNITTKW